MTERTQLLRWVKAPLWSLFLFCLCAVVVHAAPRPPAAAIASAHPLATEAGLAVLDVGGNAFDAAVAVSAALAVVEPYGSGIGGGGFWLLHRARDNRQVMIDGRERAPLAATPDLYLDDRGEVVSRASIDGVLAAGIPGAPAALVHIARHYGRLPLAVTLGPAIVLARDGFPIDPVYRRMASFRRDALRASPAASAQLLVDGQLPDVGYVLRQPDLADTLHAIAEQGMDGFYAGPVAARLVAAVRAHGGIWEPRDLAQYRVVERAPVVTRYRGHRVVSAGLPSSGGVVLTQMLQMLDHQPLDRLEGASRVHLLAEVMRRAYADRARYLGDSDYVYVPLGRLLDPGYARARAASIDRRRASVSADMAGATGEGRHTTHFSILDRDGNRVAATLSINYPFGSGFVADGTGVLLNNEMDDFSAKPGVANVYGLVGNRANAIAPGKRMLSSMSPTFVEGPERITILGTPGGSRIITMVLHGILDSIAGRPLDQWIARGRFHHQYLPDRIEVEPGALSTATIATLEAMGHRVRRLADAYGNMQAITWDRRRGTVEAASDPRGIGLAVVEPPLRDHAAGRASSGLGLIPVERGLRD